MRTVATALIVFTLACSSPTGTDNGLPSGDVDLAVLQGGNQTVAVTDSLPRDIIVKVTKGGVALSDQVVDWVVTRDRCGSPFVTTTRTDSAGVTGNRVVAGNRSWTRPEREKACSVEVRYALTSGDTVQARVDTTVDYVVNPGPIVQNALVGTIFAGNGRDTIPGDYVTDRFGNPGLFLVSANCCVRRVSDDPGTVGARTVAFDSAGTGELTVTAGDTVVDRAILKTSAPDNIRIDFRNHGR